MGVARFCATKQEGLASVRYRLYQLINVVRAAPRGRGRRAGDVAVACLGLPKAVKASQAVKASRFEIAIVKPQVDV